MSHATGATPVEESAERESRDTRQEHEPDGQSGEWEISAGHTGQRAERSTFYLSARAVPPPSGPG